MRGFLSALSFLTICPVPAAVHRDRAALRSSPGWFPLVGLLVGAVAAGAFVTLGFLPALPRAVLVVTIPVLLTRALHLDGFADVCDGLGVTGPVARRLEVMRDPRLGAFGVAGVVLNLLLRVAVVAALPESGWVAIAAAPLFGRWALVVALTLVPYAGAGFTALKTRLSTGTLVGASLLPCLSLWMPQMPVLVMPGVVMLAVGWLVVVRRTFRALTGDSLGALNELSELLVLFVFLAAGGQVSGR